MLKLRLFAKPGNYYLFDYRKSNSKFNRVLDDFYIKNNKLCQFCNVEIKNNHSIVNIDHDYANNVKSNLALSCLLCARTQLLDFYPLSYQGTDKLVYWPELSQAEINRLLTELVKKSLENNDDLFSIKTLYSYFNEKSDILTHLCSSEVINPGFYRLISSSSYSNHKIISGIRILFSYDFIKNNSITTTDNSRESQTERKTENSSQNESDNKSENEEG
ncbi:putative intracellular multiplication protein IcmJ [Piscirickettsia salmonis]|uniref:Type IV secretion system protein IcmJ n=1 Tax=Piscirickettsia salmonis TaxID=1238 RepID=A0AAC8ZPS3_PISSA|nr:hypothetical protein [Piscirickettsia salmonis]AKP72658.1 hypothetical protein PSLF89_516 [Piscirickettsia salmonis LF-89 = ATCC VR-1361]ALB23851.1 type IV secretion system protein IcmJ [Piscirickettsia salmonis]ALY03690.1 hypothetical protein AWE47_13170 [Piscirickettsia salmonis]AMA43253.1 hypothetical protein AWJ11_13395 [Piscirickettsia salmonis]AOS35723.1 hypothetical protein AVM72_10515 [Piscirickettsia salmonis]